MSSRLRPALLLVVIAVLVTLPVLIATYKVVFLGYVLSDILPRTRYTVSYRLRYDGHDGDLRIRTFAPLSDSRQEITAEQNLSPGLHMASETSGLNRVLTWSSPRARDGGEIQYTFSVLSAGVTYELAPDLPLPAAVPASLASALQPEPEIQVDDPAIAEAVQRAGADSGSLTQRLRAIYDATHALKRRPFKGTTDALTALRLGEASCNGKSRLFVAMARAVGIPARLVGGFIMSPGTKRTSHQWVEAYAAGHWVPFDPTNAHFAELPEHYLALYVGDEVLFKHTRDINFQYQMETTTALWPSPKAKASFKLFNIWNLFERLGLSFMLLRTLLMLPLGALVVVLFRNVVGMPTFGTFLPALVAAAAGETGLGWGVVGVLLIVLAAALARRVFHRLQLLHSPSLAILLTVVSIAILSIALFADRLGLHRLAYVSLFPIAVMAITAERFFLALTEKGARSALKDLAGTLVVIAACYVVMNSLALQVLIIGFPEVLLISIAANVYLGRWVGMRLSEYLRFRGLLAAPGAAR